MSPLELTLVVHYGAKPAPLAGLLGSLVGLIDQRWGKAFEPYSLGQMHATLIGLEAERVDGVRVNRWFWTHRGQRRVADPERIAALVQAPGRLPFRVQFGGFRADGAYPFTSRGQHPHERTFQLQDSQVVLMGWPEHDGGFPRTLAELRHGFEAANLLHKYHAAPQDDDNDLFLVLGHLDRTRLGADPEVGAAEVREYLALNPTWVDVDRDALQLVAYSDPRLPEGECQAWPLEPEALRATLRRG